MSLIFEKLTLKNWLVYGSATVVFPRVEPGRNLIVLNGSNGFGKTSFLRALEFVFHKVDNNRTANEELHQYWNRRAKSNGDNELSVTLDFLHDNIPCSISRTVTFRKTSTRWNSDIATRFYKNKVMEENQVDDKIQEIIPRDCLEFFLFDGAEIARYAQKQHQDGVRKAIEKVLGIPSVGNLAIDMGKVVSKLEEELRDALERQGLGQQLIAEIETLRLQIGQAKTEKTTINEKITNLNQTLTQLKDEYDSIGGLENLVEKIRDKNRSKTKIEEQIRELDKEVAEGNTYVPAALVLDILREISGREKANREVLEGGVYEQHLLEVLGKLLNDDHCLCGNDIDDKAYQNIQSHLQKIESRMAGYPSLDVWSLNDLSLIDSLIQATVTAYAKIPRYFDTRNRRNIELEEIDTEIGRLEEERRMFPDVNVSDYPAQIKGIEEDIASQKAIMERVEKRLQEAESELLQKERERDRLGGVEEQTRGLTRKQHLASQLQKAAEELGNGMVEAKRAEIEEKASTIFNAITNKKEEYEKLKIREGYTVQVLLRDGSTIENTELSAGEKEVVAYSFMTALNLASRNPAPFVMDTPFGHLDKKHRDGLLDSLPKLGVQVVLLATDRDLPHEQRDAFDSAIIKEFNLIRDQNLSITNIAEDTQ